jgi:hypothetical protein
MQIVTARRLRSIKERARQEQVRRLVRMRNIVLVVSERKMEDVAREWGAQQQQHARTQAQASARSTREFSSVILEHGDRLTLMLVRCNRGTNIHTAPLAHFIKILIKASLVLVLSF